MSVTEEVAAATAVRPTVVDNAYITDDISLPETLTTDDHIGIKTTSVTSSILVKYENHVQTFAITSSVLDTEPVLIDEHKYTSTLDGALQYTTPFVTISGADLLESPMNIRQSSDSDEDNVQISSQLSRVMDDKVNRADSDEYYFTTDSIVVQTSGNGHFRSSSSPLERIDCSGCSSVDVGRTEGSLIGVGLVGRGELLFILLGVTVTVTVAAILLAAIIYRSRWCRRHSRKSRYQITDHDLSDYRGTLRRTLAPSPTALNSRPSSTMCPEEGDLVDPTTPRPDQLTSLPVILRKHRPTTLILEQQRFSMGPVMLGSMSAGEDGTNSDEPLSSTARTYKEMYSVDTFRASTTSC